jgi:hypothetical protein
MSIFGWSYPPGAADDPSAPYNQDDDRCWICGGDVDSCVCDECPVCGTIGDPDCYTEHGMKHNATQLAVIERHKLEERERIERENALYQMSLDEHKNEEQI